MALILMGDWCGPGSDTECKENRGALPRRSNADELIR